MRDFISQQAKGLQQGGIRAFFDKASQYSDVINLGIGEPDLDTPRPVMDAAYEAMLAGHTHYTANAGDTEVRQQIAAYLSEFDVTVDPAKEVIMTIGGMGAVSQCLLCTIDPGDEVLIQDPQWLNYYSQVKFAGGVPVAVPVYQENGFSLQAEEIEKHITPRTKILMINSPNNPTGAVMSQKDLEAVAEVAMRHDLLVISDEVYCELLYDGEHHRSIASIPGMKERTVIVNSFSKSFSMTGWRVGFAAGAPEVIAKMTVLQENLAACAPAFGQWAAKYALETKCQLGEMRELYQRRRDLIVDGLNDIKGIHCEKPRGAFYAFPDIRGLGLTSQQAAEKLLEEVQVVAIPGSAFGEHGEGFLRMAYANSEENIKEALRRIRKCFEG